MLSKKTQNCISLVLVAFNVIMWLSLFPIRKVHKWVDERTGSKKYREEQWFGLRVREILQPSSLENWIHEHKLSVTPHWKERSSFEGFLFGDIFQLGNSRQGAGVWTASELLSEEFLQRYLAKATEEEIKQLVETLRVSTEDDQMQAVEQAIVKYSD